MSDSYYVSGANNNSYSSWKDKALDWKNKPQFINVNAGEELSTIGLPPVRYGKPSGIDEFSVSSENAIGQRSWDEPYTVGLPPVRLEDQVRSWDKQENTEKFSDQELLACLEEAKNMYE